MSLESEQIALEKIHRLSKLIQNFVSRHDNKILVRRLCVGYLRDLGRLTDQLFETYGARAMDILNELESLEASFLRIQSAKGMSTDVDPEKGDENFVLDESPVIATLVQQGRLEFAIGERLFAAIIDVREKEKTFDFQQRVWTDKKRMAMKMECSADHFTYGTTSLSAWADVTSSTPWEQSVNDLEYSSPNTFLEFVVFGSSTGLLLFYLAAMYPGATCTGYEVMPSLHELSSQLAEEHLFENVDCKLQDMMKANISSATVVVLTSLCWDEATRRAVAHKLARELPPGSLVIDYRSDTFSIHGVQDDAKAYYKSRSTKREKGGLHRDITSSSAANNRTDTATGAADDEVTDARIRSCSTDRLMRHLSAALFTVDHKAVCDRAVYRQVNGASYVENSDSNSGGAANLDKGSSGAGAFINSFKMVGIVEGRTSWNDRQKLYVYKCARK